MEKPQKTSRRVRGTITGLNETARTLRHAPTVAEKVLWEALRGRKLGGLKFRRQHPVGRFILDFFCAEYRLVVELDGGIHVAQAEHDAERTRLLSEFGYCVLRFRNEEVTDDLPSVLRRISEATQHISEATQCISDTPPPILGEGPGVRAE